jgi:PAS domain S-box-containing protein
VRLSLSINAESYSGIFLFVAIIIKLAMKNIYRFSYPIIFLLFTFITITASQASSDKKLRVGVSNSTPPLSFVEKHTNITEGLSIDLVEKLAAAMGLTIRIYAMNDSDLIEALNNGNVDIILGFVDDGYSNVNIIETSVSVNRNYFYNNQYLGSSSNSDFLNYPIAIEKGNPFIRLLTSRKNVNYIEAESQEEALALVDSGKAKVYISKDSYRTLELIKNSGFQNIYQAPIPFRIDPLVIAVKKGNNDLLADLDTAYRKILLDGVYHNIYNKWLRNDPGSIVRKYRQHIIVVSLIVIFVFLLSTSWSFLLKRKVDKIKENLRKSEQKYRDLIESSPDMIYLISRDGDIRLANKIVLRHLGYSKEEITSLRLHDLVPPEQAGDVIDFIDMVFLYRYSNKELTLIAKNGDRINVEVVANILEEADSTESLACCFSRDLTERKRLEEELIHSDRLAIIGRMAAGIAHEINNPLWIILSNAEDMLSHQLSHEELHECLKSIERNGLRAAKSIEDLLSFARPAPMKVVAIDLLKVIEDSFIFLKQKLKKKGIRVEKRYPSESIILQGDENLIQQLLINIILNAIQALDKDGLITISVSVTEKNGDRGILLEIKDNGKGIPDEDLKYIFNPFYTSGKTGGFGLGLFMSKIIVEKHHGDLAVKSQHGKGTVFTICFRAQAGTEP